MVRLADMQTKISLFMEISNACKSTSNVCLIEGYRNGPIDSYIATDFYYKVVFPGAFCGKP